MEHIGHEANAPLSPAVRAGDLLFISGQASTDPDTGEFIAGTFEDEFWRSVGNLYRVIRLAGAHPSQIVKISAFVKNETDLPTYRDLYLTAFDSPRPARTTLQMGFCFLKFEIEAILYTGDA